MLRARFALVMVPALATMSALGAVGCSSEVVVTDTGSPSPSPSSSATTTPTTTPSTPSTPEPPKKSYVRFLHSGFQYADNAKLCLRKDGETTYSDFTKTIGLTGVPQGSMTRYVELAAGTYFAAAANAKDGCPTADPTRPEPSKVTVAAGYSTVALYGNGGYTGEFGPHVGLFADDVTAPDKGRKIRALHFGVTYSQAETLYSGSSPLFPDMKFGTAPKSSPMGTVNAQGYLLDTSGKVTDVNAGGIGGDVPSTDKGVYTAIYQGAKGSGFFPLHVLVCPDDPTSESPLVTCN